MSKIGKKKKYLKFLFLGQYINKKDKNITLLQRNCESMGSDDHKINNISYKFHNVWFNCF